MFRKFSAESREILGSYDGRAIEIGRGSTKSHEVEVHEFIHERIFHETLDGILHRLLIIEHDSGVVSEAENRSAYLMAETEQAHEAAATYLGVQALDDIDERAETFANLPGDYQRHYQLMGDVITPLTDSTFLAFSLGWSLAFWAFHSDRIYELYRAGWSDFDAVIERIPSPTERMHLGVNVLAKLGTAWLEAGLEAAAKSYSDAGLLPWDVHDDEQWRAQALPDVGRFESLLSASLWDWLRDNVPVGAASGIDRPDGFDRWLLDRLDVPAEQKELVVKDATFDADPNNEIIIAATAALRGGKARISNLDTYKIDRVRTRQPLDRRKAVARVDALLPAAFHVGAESPKKRSGWAVYAFRRTATAVLASNELTLEDRFIVAEDFALELLSRRQITGPRQSRNGGLLMAPADATLLPHYMDRLKGLIDGLPPGGAQADPPSGGDYPLWYWIGDWPELLSMPDICTASHRVEPLGTDKAERYILHLARAETIPGYFFRLTSPLPGGAILRYEDALKVRGALGTIPHDETMHVLKSLTPFIGIILDNWYVF